LIRKEAIEICMSKIGTSPIISANGYVSRDLFNVNDRSSNFYMIGSMGLASSIGLGVAIKNPKKTIYVFDGDGNILMNLGSLATISKIKPRNLVHIILDNNSHESTGGQPTDTNQISIDLIANSLKIKVFKTSSKNELQKIFKKIKKISGPIMLLIKIKSGSSAGKRISFSPEKIRTRFMDTL
tara:strand:- start:73 stop:621 length:549 start_codon:yes stop_codon:yes gene_type:complete